jgi:hypothetical protein
VHTNHPIGIPRDDAPLDCGSQFSPERPKFGNFGILATAILASGSDAFPGVQTRSTDGKQDQPAKAAMLLQENLKLIVDVWM